MDAALLQRIDFMRLTLNLGGNKKVIHDMCDLFLESASESLEKMETAERDSNIIAWAQVAHRLKGASNNITAKRLAGLTLEAEEIKSFPHPQSEAVLYHMHKELALLREAIAEYKKLA